MEKLKRILYVEDDDDISQVVVMTLEDLGGFEVAHCTSGQAALEAAPAFAPQMIVMDVMMPGMDGPETLRRMRQMPELENVPIIFMTARAQNHEQETYRRLGAIGIILKPFDPLQLCSQIVGLWSQAA